MRIIIFITLLSSLSLGSNIGLEMKIELDKNEYLLLEPILLKYMTKNKSDLVITHPEKISYEIKKEGELKEKAEMDKIVKEKAKGFLDVLQKYGCN